MTANRSRTQVKQYSKQLRAPNQTCPFCDQPEIKQCLVQETKHFVVIKNKYPYSLWDSQKITDHLMIVPKKHTPKLGELGAGAGEEFVNLIDKYEDRGYNLYARAPSSSIKTVTHQHTHLLKPEGRMRRFVLFSKKPYIRWHF